MYKTSLSVGPSRFSEGGNIALGRYGDGELAVVVYHPNTGERQSVATVCLAGEVELLPAAPDHIWLKGWSENEGIPEALERSGLVKLTGVRCPVGPFGCEAILAELTEPFKCVVKTSGIMDEEVAA